jgi:DNA mismatch repair protein MutL
MSIQILDKNVIDQIAAGEVVERPSHLVKELLENSLDAKATAIEIYFENAGRNIEIIDNGIGISKDDLALALERHATSKISQFNDIWSLDSFGFRGEALASISAVSDFEIVSRAQGSEKSFKLNSSFGKISPVLETSSPVGTHIRINDLFENVPVRLKFLKTSSYEHGLIKQVVKAMALSQPSVEFKVYENRKLIYFYPKTVSLAERVKAVLNAKEVFTLEVDDSGHRLECVYSSPYQVEKNTKNIWLFVQNRWVQDKVMVASIMESYQNLLMHGEYPQVVLKLFMPPEQVDVNIHPTKSQIKFLNSQTVYRLIYKNLRRDIEKAPWKKIEDFASSVNSVQRSTSQNSEFFSSSGAYHNSSNGQMENPSVGSGDLFGADVKFGLMGQADQKALPQFELERKQYQQKDFNFKENTPWVQVKTFENQNSVDGINRSFDSRSVNSRSSDANVFRWASLHVIGQMNLTYIVCQDDQKMVLVDQHAAHERVLFEKFKSQYQENKISIQNMLIPLSLDLDTDQIEILNENVESLKKLGVEFELLGPNTIGIVSLPSFLKEASAVELIRKFIEEVKDLGGSFVFEKKLNDLIATMSCHSAIRAGQALSRDEMEKLLHDMDEYPLSSFCPHGRPVNVEVPFKQIERDFGRIV